MAEDIQHSLSKNVVIFGGGGFVGSAAAEAFAAKNYHVTCVSRHANAKDNQKNITHVAADASDEAATTMLCKDADIVMISIGVLFETKHVSFTRAHADIPEIIAKAASSANVRSLIHLSALGIEEAQDSLYAQSKKDGESRIRKAFPHAVILRPSIIFGPKDNFFNMFADMAKFSPALPLVGGGRTRFAPVYVNDVAAAAVVAAEKDDMQGKIITCVGPRIYTFKELLHYVLQVTGRKRCLAPLPFCIAGPIGKIMQKILPNPPLTDDQVRLLKTDNIAAADAFTLKDVGLQPVAVEDIVPSYLS